VATSLPTAGRVDQSQVRPLESPGTGDGAPPRHPKGRWLAVAAGGVGLVVGLLFGGGGRSENPAEAGSLSVLSPDDQASGLALAVPDFPDVLLVVGTDGTRPLELLSWPPNGRLDRLGLPASWSAVTLPDGPFEDFARFDVSGRQIALAAPVARDNSITLFAGRPEAAVAVAGGVSSYAWHAANPHSLAYVVEDESGTWLEVMAGSPRSVQRIQPVTPGEELIAWLEAGFVMGGPDGLVLRGPDSAVAIDGSLLDAAESLVLLDRRSEIGYLEVPAGAYEPSGIPGGAVIARFSPDQASVAVARPEAVEIWKTAGGSIFEADIPSVAHMAWSSDGRFLVVLDRVDVVVIDTADGSAIRLGLGPAVAVAVRPLPLSSP